MFTERALNELQELLVELDTLLGNSGAEVSARTESAVASWRAKLKHVQESFSHLHAQAHQRAGEAARAGGEAMREHPWQSVAVAAAAGLLLGMAIGGRERH